MDVRTSARVALLGTTPLLAVACGGDPRGAGAELEAQVAAIFQAGGDGPAFTYDAALVPVGASAEVTSVVSSGATTVTLRVAGLRPDRSYGAYAHAEPCAADGGTAAGPRYQFSQDPVTPSVDPAYANSQNEVRLGLTTDARGVAEASATVPWRFPDDRRAAAVVLHEVPPSSGAGRAGAAGSRPACVTVDF